MYTSETRQLTSLPHTPTSQQVTLNGPITESLRGYHERGTERQNRSQEAIGVDTGFTLFGLSRTTGILALNLHLHGRSRTKSEQESTI